MSAILIPHRDTVLDEIFAVPPAPLFPAWRRPETVAELAAHARMDVAATLSRLERIRVMAEDIEITPEELRDLLAANQGTDGDGKGAVPELTPIILLDVREAWEFEICRIEGSLRLGDVLLQELMPRLQAARQVVTICHHGVRSFSAAMYLKENGVPRVMSLAGGVEAWARQIDRAMERY